MKLSQWISIFFLTSQGGANFAGATDFCDKALRALVDRERVQAQLRLEKAKLDGSLSAAHIVVLRNRLVEINRQLGPIQSDVVLDSGEGVASLDVSSSETVISTVTRNKWSYEISIPFAGEGIGVEMSEDTQQFIIWDANSLLLWDRDLNKVLFKDARTDSRIVDLRFLGSSRRIYSNVRISESDVPRYEREIWVPSFGQTNYDRYPLPNGLYPVRFYSLETWGSSGSKLVMDNKDGDFFLYDFVKDKIIPFPNKKYKRVALHPSGSWGYVTFHPEPHPRLFLVFDDRTEIQPKYFGKQGSSTLAVNFSAGAEHLVTFSSDGIFRAYRSSDHKFDFEREVPELDHPAKVLGVWYRDGVVSVRQKGKDKPGLDIFHIAFDGEGAISAGSGTYRDVLLSAPHGNLFVHKNSTVGAFVGHASHDVELAVGSIRALTEEGPIRYQVSPGGRWLYQRMESGNIRVVDNGIEEVPDSQERPID